MKAISVRQPWAWLIFHGKDIENRDRYWSHRGPLAIHASKGMTTDEWLESVEFVRSFDPVLADKIPAPEKLVFGAVIGTVNMTDCVRGHRSPFFVGPRGLVFTDAKMFDGPVPAKGQLGLWEWTGGKQ